MGESSDVGRSETRAADRNEEFATNAHVGFRTKDQGPGISRGSGKTIIGHVVQAQPGFPRGGLVGLPQSS